MTKDSHKEARLEPVIIHVRDVLNLMDQVLSGRADISEIYLLACDIVEGIECGAAELEDEKLLEPVSTIAKAKAINLLLVEEVRSRLSRGRDAGTA